MRRILTLLLVLVMLVGIPTVVRSQQPTPQQRTAPQEQTVYVTKTGKKYHRARCSYLRSSTIPISLKDAKANGYTPCSRCRPPQ